MAATTCRGHAAVMPPPPSVAPPPVFGLQLGAAGNVSNSSRTTASAPLFSRRHLGICTEGLGSESSEGSGDVDLGSGDDDVLSDSTKKDDVVDQHALPCKRQQRPDDEHEEAAVAADVPVQAPLPLAWARNWRAFPPPISVIGAGGKPWLYLRAHRGDGRLVLREVRIPSRELLQACREDGRFKLHFAHPEEQEDQQLVHDPDLADATLPEQAQEKNE